MPAPEQSLILNRYRLQETRGHGGFARVDIAWDNRLRRRVALKRIPLQVSEDDLPGIEEARTAALLEDPHIVSVYDFELTGTEAILIMENVDGPTLAELMAGQENLLDLNTISAILSPIAQALEHAHENQVLHLDIKPANILINHQGNIKVSDFGLAELSSTAGFSEAQGGTIGYMPPEQIEMGSIDERTDLWAFAALAYQLICGTNPFFAHTPEESLELIIDKPIALPTTLRPELDPGINDVLIGALNAEKDIRPAKIRSFWRELTPYLGKNQTGRKTLRALVLSLDANDDPEANVLAAEASGTAGIAHSEAGQAAVATFSRATDDGSKRIPLIDWLGIYTSDDDDVNDDDELAPSQPDSDVNFTSGSTRKERKARRTTPGVPLWQRASPLLQTVLTRGLVATACGSCSWFATSALLWAGAAGGIPGASTASSAAAAGAAEAASALEAVVPAATVLDGFFLIQLIASIVVSIVAYFAPTLGGAVVALLLPIACFVAGYPLLGVGLALGLIAWWFCAGRRSVADTTVLALTPLAGTLGLPFLLPLLAGAFLPWRRALAATLTTTLLLAVLSVLCTPVGSLGLALPLHASLSLANPGSLGTAFDVALYKPYALAFAKAEIWLALFAALLGTLTSAFICKKATRASCVSGTVLATAIIGVGTILPALMLLPDLGLVTASAEAISLVICCVLLCLLVVAGVLPMANTSKRQASDAKGSGKRASKQSRKK